MSIQVARVYDHEAHPGRQFLVDRLWPRGVRKDDLPLDGWLKEVAPSDRLRKWFAHDPRRWTEFRRRYRAELRAHAAALQPLRERGSRQRVTLLYAARDPRISHALVLRSVLRAAPPKRTPRP